VKKRLRNKLKEIRQQLRKRLNQRVSEMGKWLRSVVQGYFNYHAVPGNFAALALFRREVARAWRSVLSRRSQRGKRTWESIKDLVERFLPRARIQHPMPDVRFDAMHPR
jgi:hypothetical protein